MMKQGSLDRQNAYPCIFMKKKNLPDNKATRLRRMMQDDSDNHKVWVQFNETIAFKGKNQSSKSREAVPVIGTNNI